MIRRFVLISIIVLLNVQILAGCMFDENRPQTRYHENVEDIEKFLLDELGEYLFFRKPSIGTAYSIDEHRTVNDSITWNVVFRREYIYNEDLVSEVHPGHVISYFFEMYNSYIKEHKDHYLSSYNVDIHFYIPAKNSDEHSDECGELTTYDFESWNNRNTQLTGVSLPDEYWPYMYDQSDVETAAMMENSDNCVIKVVTNMPQLEKIIIHDCQVEDSISEIRPDIEVISR